MTELPAALYPFAPHYLTLPDGATMHYVDEGSRDAPTVLMLHGNPTWSFYWRHLIEALAPNFRVIAPDHIGCGKSDKPDDDAYDYRLDRRIADIEALVAHLSLRDITLVVHDWGGMIGLGWADRNPERLSRLVVLNTAAFPLPSSKRLPASLWLARNTGLGALLVRGMNAFCVGATRLAVTRKKLPKEIRDALCAPYDSWDHRRAVLRFVQDIPLSESDPSYATVAGV
ncbi:MAG: alpha/beta fold hydrolase, partial [Myxococcota bacterium]